MTNTWQRDEAEARIREVLDAAKAHESQTLIDRDGTYAVVFTRRKQGLEKLFSNPGPLRKGDL